MWLKTRTYLKIAFWRSFFWLRYQQMQPIWTVWTTLAVDHQGIISVKFGQIRMGGDRRENYVDDRRKNTGHNKLTLSTWCSSALNCVDHEHSRALRFAWLCWLTLSYIKGKLSNSFTNYNYVGNTKVSVSIKKT